MKICIAEHGVKLRRFGASSDSLPSRESALAIKVRQFCMRKEQTVVRFGEKEGLGIRSNDKEPKIKALDTRVLFA
ncbi:hypothetical protein PG987_006190 [Apiospora arundinis]